MVKLAILILRHMLSSGQLKISLPGKPDIVVTARNRGWRAGKGQHPDKGASTGIGIGISLPRPSALLALALRPDPLIGEYYMRGELVLTEGSFEDFIAFLFQNTQSWRHSVIGAIYCQFWEIIGWFASLNPIGRSRRNVAHHYDLTDQLFDLFLDENRQYSCAYFRGTADTLDIAQKQKIARLAAKLHLQANMRVLDIGCGWGGLATALSKCADNLHITGITLSENQYAFFKKSIAENSLNKQLSVELQDYRKLGHRRFERIISVGMLEHVGKQNLNKFMATIDQHLADNGVAVIHSIGRNGPPCATSPWLMKYIFPGGYLPTLRQMMQAIERTTLKVTDIEIMRLHYAETLSHWRTRFEAHKDKLPEHYDEAFIRMWQFYLICSENYFRYAHGMVFQIQLARRQEDVPQTRDYIANEERRVLKLL